MKFAIRDDDTSFFTKPDDLRRAYSFIENEIVSLSIVPFTVTKHKDKVYPYGPSLIEGKYAIGKYEELVSYLRQEVQNRKYDILLHGSTHQYKKN